MRDKKSSIRRDNPAALERNAWSPRLTGVIKTCRGWKWRYSTREAVCTSVLWWPARSSVSRTRRFDHPRTWRCCMSRLYVAARRMDTARMAHDRHDTFAVRLRAVRTSVIVDRHEYEGLLAFSPSMGFFGLRGGKTDVALEGDRVLRYFITTTITTLGIRCVLKAAKALIKMTLVGHCHWRLYYFF